MGPLPARNSTRLTGSLGLAATAIWVFARAVSSGAVIETARGTLLTITETEALVGPALPATSVARAVMR
jgi:hypothetical protein